MSQESYFSIQDHIRKTEHLLPPSIQQKIDIVLVSQVMKQNSLGLWTSIFCATILAISSYKVETLNLILSWYGFFWLVTVARFILIKYFLRQPLKNENVAFWTRLFIVGVCLSGLCWGFAGAFLLPYENPIQFTLMIMIIAGMTAGAVPLLAGILNATIVYLMAVLLPLSINLLLMFDVLSMLFGLVTLVYLGYLIVLSIKTHRMIVLAISLQFENDTLLQHLSLAKKELELANKRLTHAATHDFLTNLANRGLFEIKFSEALQRAKQKRKVLALFYIDIDNFKRVNDAYGHLVGDKLLQEIAKRIKQYVPTNGFAARLGGDEISILIEDISDMDTVVELAEKLCGILSEPFIIKNFTVLITVSIGVSMFIVDGDKPDELLKNADNAMYFVKHKGGNDYHFNTDIAAIRAVLSKSF